MHRIQNSEPFMGHVLKHRLILARNRDKLEREVNETQSGFITGKGIWERSTTCERYVKDVWTRIKMCMPVSLTMRKPSTELTTKR